jgi:hypothetical protein
MGLVARWMCRTENKIVARQDVVQVRMVRRTNLLILQNVLPGDRFTKRLCRGAQAGGEGVLCELSVRRLFFRGVEDQEPKMSIADLIYEQVKALPNQLAREVLDFAGFLRERQDRAEWRDAPQPRTLASVWDNSEDKVWDDV